MRTENRKIILIITLAMTAFLIDTITLLDFILRKETGLLSFHWLNEVGFFRWGWALVFVFASVSLVGAIRWKCDYQILRVIIAVISVTALVLALPWFWIMCFLTIPS